MISPIIKPYLALIAIALSFVGYVPYIISIWRNQTKPHAFTWLIWTLSTLIVFSAQVVSQAGAGAWGVGISGIVSAGITILSYYKQSDDTITKSDWIFLIASLAAIPAWALTNNALYAVIIITFIDVMGYGPTLRKAYHKPDEEHVGLFLIMNIRNVFSLLALDVYSLTNMLFQTTTSLINFMVIALVFWRRHVIKTNIPNLKS